MLISIGLKVCQGWTDVEKYGCIGYSFWIRFLSLLRGRKPFRGKAFCGLGVCLEDFG